MVHIYNSWKEYVEFKDNLVSQTVLVQSGKQQDIVVKTTKKQKTRGKNYLMVNLFPFQFSLWKKSRSNDTSLAISLEPLGGLLQAAVCLRQNIPKEPWPIGALLLEIRPAFASQAPYRDYRYGERGFRWWSLNKILTFERSSRKEMYKSLEHFVI